MVGLVAVACRLPAQRAPTDSVSIRVVNTDLRSAVQIIAQYLDKPVLFAGSSVSSAQVTLETPHPVPRRDVVRLLRGLLESQNFELVDDTASGTYRARTRQALPQVQGVPDPPKRPTGAPELFVITLKHARAADVATTVNALFGRTSSSMSDPASRTPTLADELRANQVPPVGAPLPQSVAGAAGRSATLTGELTIVPDSRANSLLVRANRTDFELIAAAVQQIDVRPLQVMIEVLIVEARKDRSFTFGVDASIAKQKVAHTENTAVSAAQSSGLGLGDFVLRVMGVSGFDLDATLLAAAGRGDVRIVSRPVVLAANNEQAEVIVGSQRPFVQVSRALPTDAAVRDQIVQYRDVGTKLTVRPTISVDGSVQLSVAQEVSSATTETAFNAPIISNRSVRTELLVRDGQTVALGGLSDKQRDADQGGIPILSSIPFLGGLFGHVSRRTTETELVIFITPRVIRTDDDAAKATDPLKRSADMVRP